MGGFRVARIGAPFDLTYPVEDIGEGPETLRAVAEGKHEICAALEAAERPVLILGSGAVARADGAAVLALAHRIAERFGLVVEGWNGFNLLHTAAARVAGLDLGLVPGKGGRDVAGILDGAENGEIDIVWLLGADEIEVSRLTNAFVVYQGHHGDRGAPIADLILPGAAYTEKNATWVNLEGRPQHGRLSVFPPGEAREDWKILRAASEAVGRTVPLDNIFAVRARMAELAPHLARTDDVTPAEWGRFGRRGKLDKAPFVSPVTDFYLTNPIARASRTMQRCSREILRPPAEEATGTHG